jgi:hypothetical protein
VQVSRAGLPQGFDIRTTSVAKQLSGSRAGESVRDDPARHVTRPTLQTGGHVGRHEADHPGPPAYWETVKRSWDKDDRLVSEVVMVTTETDNSPPEPERRTGLYL